MIECPFCCESFEEDELVYEFSWGDVSTFFYNRKQLAVEPKNEYRDRAFYVTMKYDWRGRPLLGRCASVINPEKHPRQDPLCTAENGWDRMVQLLSGKNVFEVECSPDDRTLPISAKILPISKAVGKKDAASAEGVSTGTFCPFCEQELRADVLKAKSEVRILLTGRPGSGKTVYTTQVISELMQGRLAQAFKIEPANESVHEHYRGNKNRLRAFGKGFVLATNPGAIQEPYVYYLKNGKSTIRLVIQDVAGEDTENRMKYSKMTRKADMVLYFVDPWHIEEVRAFHKRTDDLSNAIVDRSTNGRYSDLNGIFQQMMSSIDYEFTTKNGQLAAVMLIKGDYLHPPMLSRGNQPECEMMQQPIPFNNPEEMEFLIGMRSSFIRQCMHEWNSTREFARDVESKYSSHSIRYFVASALGQSTHLRQDGGEDGARGSVDVEDPDAQFNVGSSAPSPAVSSERWNYDEQVLETVPRPENVIDPIFWCLKRKGIEF